MKSFFLLILLSCFSSLAFCQVEAPFSFLSEDENRMLKEEDSGKFFVASGDTSKIVFINEETSAYKLFDKDHKLIAEGNFSTDGEKYLREGKWDEYYSNGNKKSSGYYRRNIPVGNWEKYYPNGKPRLSCTYVVVENGSTYGCMAGSYREYYDNGQLKSNGFYKATIDDQSFDTVHVVDPMTEKKVLKITKGKSPRPEKYGTWEYYNDKGELTKKEDF